MIPRTHRAALALVLAIAGAPGCDRSPPKASVRSATAAAPKEDSLAADDRIAYLLAPCPFSEAFLADTSDMTSILVAKLRSGRLDPLKFAKSELEEIGDAAMPELRAAFDKSFPDPNGEPHLLNILTVAALTPSDGGHGILLRGLEHPAEAVRIAAVRGLQRHPDPSDYDKIRGLLPISGAEMQSQIAKALAACDKKRLEDDFLANPPNEREHAFEQAVIGSIADTRRADVIDEFVRRYPTDTSDMRMFMAGAAARMGNADARDALLKWMRDDKSELRGLAAQALIRAGFTAELAPRLREEKDDAIREAIASAVASLPPTPETKKLLASALSDRTRNVRMTCLLALVKMKDDAAVNSALELLKGDSADLESGLRVLREAWKDEPALAERAFAILLALRRHETEPVRVGPAALDRAIAQLPLEAAARYLYDLALKTPGDVEGVRAHRWFLQQAGNTGPAGWSFLRARWDEETDPARRMDIVMACSYEITTERSREFLIAVVESERSTPFEVLYAAQFLARRGPSARIAPILKRATLRIEQPEVRRALNCMLWEWYGPGT
jgi:HEAT repeat protein